MTLYIITILNNNRVIEFREIINNITQYLSYFPNYMFLGIHIYFDGILVCFRKPWLLKELFLTFHHILLLSACQTSPTIVIGLHNCTYC